MLFLEINIYKLFFNCFTIFDRRSSPSLHIPNIKINIYLISLLTYTHIPNITINATNLPLPLRFDYQVALTIHWLGRSVQSWFIGPQIDTSAFVDLITYHSIQPPPSQSPSALSQAPMQPPAPAASRVEMRHNRGPSSSNNGYGDQLGGRGHDPPSATPVDSSAGYKNYNNMEDSYHDFDRKKFD